MIKADLHCHTIASMDGNDSAAAMARAACERGLSVLCITDHCECNGFSGTDVVYMQKEADEGRRALAEITGIDLPRGIELGQAAERPEEAARVLSNNPGLDFIIGSLHNLKGERDFFDHPYGSGETCLALLERYLDELFVTARTTELDVIGHLGYPLRYMLHNEGFRLDFSPFEDRLRTLFTWLAEHGKGLEVNTQPIRKGWGADLLCPKELKLFREAGGEIVTVGSDAHRTGEIADGFEVAEELLRQAGFRYYAHFSGRKPVFHKL